MIPKISRISRFSRTLSLHPRVGLERGAIVFAGLGQPVGSVAHAQKGYRLDLLPHPVCCMTAMISIKRNFYSNFFPQVYENKEK
jgi:hypothetical protein